MELAVAVDAVVADAAAADDDVAIVLVVIVVVVIRWCDAWRCDAMRSRCCSCWLFL